MLYTAQFSYKGVDRYDITYKTGNIFAPTEKMVMDYKNSGDKDVYTLLYNIRMRESYRNNRWQWQKMVDMSRECDIVLVCYCKSGDFCHRVLLAEMLQKCGAIYGGER